MDWKKYYDEFADITKNDKIVKSKGIDDLTNYKEIGRYNLSNLKIGMHIKYVKNVYDMRTDKTYEKIYNGGFLLNIINPDKVVEMVLVLKSNIIWKMRFIRYKIYGKDPELFVKPQSEISIINKIAKEFKDDIEKKKEELRNRYAVDPNIIAEKKKKYNIIFKEEKLDIDLESDALAKPESESESEPDNELMSEINKTFIKQTTHSSEIKKRILLNSISKYKNI
jgi:hypothetical protein